MNDKMLKDLNINYVIMLLVIQTQRGRAGLHFITGIVMIAEIHKSNN